MNTAPALDTTTLRVIRNKLRTPGWVDFFEEGNRESVLDLDIIISEVFQIDPDLLFKRTRKKEIKNARFAWMYIMNRWFNYSFKALGRITSWSYSDVLHACNKVDNFRDTEYSYRQKMMRLEKIISTSMIRVPQDPAVGNGDYNLIYRMNQKIQSTRIEKK